MKNKLYYLLFVVYALVVVFILYINGVFSQDTSGLVNLLINVGFLVIIGILFIISSVSFSRLNRCTDDLCEAADQLYQEYKEKGQNLWESCRDKKDLFHEEILKTAFSKYKARISNYRTKRGYAGTCDLEEYINEDLLDQAAMTYYNSGIAGTMTGLGILGTFLGLTMGLGSFDGNDIFTISDNVGPLLSGMKVAFHTSVYGIFFSLVFNFVYRSIMSDAYEKLERFLQVFRQCAMPPEMPADENGAAMLVYQANMSRSMKEIAQLLRGNALDQTAGVECIVKEFVEQMQSALGTDFGRFGNTMRATQEAQQAYADNCRNLIDAATALVEVNRNVQETLAQIMKRQEEFAQELNAQKEKLEDTCENISDEVSSQLYTFTQTRSAYEK